MVNDLKINGKEYLNVANLKAKRKDNSIGTFYDTGDATVDPSKVLKDQVAYGKNGMIIGTYQPPAGYSEENTQEWGIGDILFIDYYGQVVKSYKTSELPLENLPAIPTLSGENSDKYTFSWRKTLEEVNAMTSGGRVLCKVEVAESTPTVFIPDENGFTETMYIYYYSVNTSTSVKFDWGDGTTSNVNAPTSGYNSVNHTYSTPCHNPISVLVTSTNSGIFMFGNYSNSSYGLGYQNRSPVPQTKEIRFGSKTGIGSYGMYQYDSSRYGVSAFEKIILPEGITLRDYSFTSSSNLKGVCIPESVTNIPGSCFSSCNLGIICLPETISTVSGSAFYYNKTLTFAFLEEGIKSINNNCFQSCYSLKHIFLPSTLNYIGGGCFSSCYSLNNISIPDTVTSLESSTFSSCFGLSNIQLSRNITSFGTDCFRGCYSLRSIMCPKKLKTVGTNCFYECYSLQSIVFEDEIASIGSSAFYNALSLKLIQIKNPSPPALSGDLPYNYYRTLRILIPAGSKTEYVSASYWVNVASRLIEV